MKAEKSTAIFAFGGASLAAMVICGVTIALRPRPQPAEAAPLPVPTVAPLPKAAPKKPEPLETAGVNEVGRIPILMYHSVGEGGAYDVHGLNISPALFRKHLEMMYDAGFYPVNMRDTLSAKIPVPKGKIPVVITFDDARGSQFRYLKNGQIDPNCAVGILDAFHKKHPEDWPQRAVFYVLPKSQYNPTPFWQGGLEKKKVQYLVSAGYELANHSTSHHPFSRMDGTRLAWEMKTCKDYFKKLDPGATMDTMALPYGIYPPKKYVDVLLKNGNRCILMAWGDANYAPADKRFDIRAIQRIGSEPGVIERWIAALKKDRKAYGKSLRPYVSDGDPETVTVPDSQSQFVDKNRLSGATLTVYPEPKPAKEKAAAKSGKGKSAKGKATKAKKAAPAKEPVKEKA